MRLTHWIARSGQSETLAPQNGYGACGGTAADHANKEGGAAALAAAARPHRGGLPLLRGAAHAWLRYGLPMLRGEQNKARATAGAGAGSGPLLPGSGARSRWS